MGGCYMWRVHDDTVYSLHWKHIPAHTWPSQSDPAYSLLAGGWLWSVGSPLPDTPSLQFKQKCEETPSQPAALAFHVCCVQVRVFCQHLGSRSGERSLCWCRSCRWWSEPSRYAIWWGGARAEVCGRRTAPWFQKGSQSGKNKKQKVKCGSVIELHFLICVLELKTRQFHHLLHDLQMHFSPVFSLLKEELWKIHTVPNKGSLKNKKCKW